MLTKISGIMTFELTITSITNKSFIAYAFINQFFALTPAFVIIATTFIITNVYYLYRIFIILHALFH